MSGANSIQIVTRPNDTSAYSAGDVIGAATATTAALTFPINSGDCTLKVVSTTLEVDSAAVISGETSYTLYLYSETPPSALGDNAAWDLPAGDRATFIGSLALGTPADVGSSLFIAVDNIQKEIHLPTGNLYAYLVTVGAYTPVANRVYRVRIVGEVV